MDWNKDGVIDRNEWNAVPNRGCDHAVMNQVCISYVLNSLCKNTDCDESTRDTQDSSMI